VKRKDPPICLLCPLPPVKIEDILKRAGSPIDIMIKSNPNIVQTGAGNVVKGSRIDATRSTVDGSIDNGTGLSTLGTYSIGTTLGGVPASKGDFTGGSFD